MRKCLWCDKKDADGIAVGDCEVVYCKECQLMLLNKYGVDTITALNLKEQLLKKCKGCE